MIDTVDQLFNRAERTSVDRFVSDQRKESFDLVKPRTVGRDEMHVPAGAGCQPRLDLRMLVTAVVVHDAVHVEIGRDGLVDFAQERQEFLMSMARFAGGEYGAVEYVQCGKQRDGTVTNIVVRDAFGVTETHWQHGLRTLERLTLALLVHVQDHGVLRWTQVQADHIVQFLDEELIARELEAFAAMRLQSQQLEITVHARRRDGSFGCDRAYALVRGTIGRFGMQGLVNQLSQLSIVDRARLTGAYFIIESVDALIQKPETPFAHRSACELQVLRDRAVGRAVRGRQHDARA